MPNRRPQKRRAPLLAAALLGCATAALLGSASAAAISTASASPTGYWKLFVAIDWRSQGTVTASDCEGQPMTASASQAISVRTVRPMTIEVHIAPNGVGVVQKELFSPAMRVKTSVSGVSGVDAYGDPVGCRPGPEEPRPPRPCRTETDVQGVFLSPRGPIGHLRGFEVGAESSESWEGEGGCPETRAQEKLPRDLSVEVRAAAKKLLSQRIPKLVFHKAQRFKATAKEGNSVSSATGSLSYTVKLVRTAPRY